MTILLNTTNDCSGVNSKTPTHSYIMQMIAISERATQAGIFLIEL